MPLATQTPVTPPTPLEATTHKGLRLVLHFFEQDPNDQVGLHKGWVCHKLEARVKDQVVGYLKIEYAPSSTLYKTLPTIWHHHPLTRWAARHENWEDVWLQAHRALRIAPKSLKGTIDNAYYLEKSHTPQSPYVLQEDLQALAIQAQQWQIPENPLDHFQQFKDWHVDRPKVGYIKTIHPTPWDYETIPDWRRLGIATLLYIEGAKWMARKGFPLWASTLQQECAAAVWNHLATREELPLSKKPVPWDTTKNTYVLDYR